VEEKCRRNGEAECPGDLQVDDQLELHRLFDGQSGGLGAFEDLFYPDRPSNFAIGSPSVKETESCQPSPPDYFVEAPLKRHQRQSLTQCKMPTAVAPMRGSKSSIIWPAARSRPRSRLIAQHFCPQVICPSANAYLSDVAAHSGFAKGSSHVGPSAVSPGDGAGL
jgi:hypothetical protein